MPYTNHMLSILPRAESALLEPHLERVSLKLLLKLENPNKPITDIYFPESGIVSVVARSRTGEEIEAGIIGREGMTGLAVVLGNDRSTNATYVQMAGQGLQIKVEQFREALQQSESLRLTFLHFAQAFMAQTSQTLLANGRSTMDARLARWILMAQDRLDGEELHLTHEFLALMLGVRRAGVTTVLNRLRKQKLIEAKRGRISVLDRKGLEERANGIYGTAEAEYRRLIGWKPSQIP